MFAFVSLILCKLSTKICKFGLTLAHTDKGMSPVAANRAATGNISKGKCFFCWLSPVAFAAFASTQDLFHIRLLAAPLLLVSPNGREKFNYPLCAIPTRPFHLPLPNANVFWMPARVTNNWCRRLRLPRHTMGQIGRKL